MNEDKQSNQPGQTGSTVGKGSAGERLDQFISGAKQFSNVAGRKAREMADAAAPKIKGLGDTATEQAQRAFNGRGAGGVLQSVLAFYNGGGKKRKQIILVAGGAYILLMIALVPFLIHNSKSSESVNDAKSEKTHNYSREAAAAAHPGDLKAQLLQRIQGKWVVDGNPDSLREIRGSKCLLLGQQRGDGGSNQTVEIPIEVNADLHPNQFYWDDKASTFRRGIIEIVDDNTLRILLSAPGYAAATKFEDGFLGGNEISRVQIWRRQED